MSANPQKVTVSKDELPTATNDPAPGCDSAESAALSGDQSNRSTHCQDSNIKTSSKKVKIVDPKQTNEVESDEEDSLSQPGAFDRANSVAAPSTSGQPSDPQATAATVTDRKKTREERKKEREKKKEEEMLKKYQAEQEAKQKVSAKSKCGRWIKHNLKIGEGGYKFVYRGYDATEAKNVAWCEFKREHVDTKEKRQAMFKETEIMLKMNHPHIVRCFDVFREWIDMEDPNNQIEEKGVVIIQELMGEGTLKSVIRKNFLEGQCILKFPLITRWWHQILDALRYMHHKIQPPILHRDLKADNCFLYGASDEEYLNVKVGDFGLATHVNNSGRKTMLGTLGFMAPEIFDEKYDEKVDIYAFGMLMLEVMTNRTPYDECETVLQVAAKTMSGQGPDIMEKVLNPSLREVISACIQPLTCFRPTAEELYFHPLFQPKTLPVEVEPNYDNATDRAEVLDRFVRSLDNTETLNPNFNLRLRFRDKKMLQELGLDDGESLEFDLDIYKAEDQDIPDLIHNLRLGYEDKLSRVFENPKQPDKKIVSNHLDKLFNSIRLQMQFLVKVLLGKRWKAILDSMVSEPRVKKRQEGSSTVDEDEESDADARDASSFAIIGKYKSKWTRAKKLLEKEIQAYRNATATTPSLSTTAGTSGTTTVTTTTVSGSTVIGATTPVTTSSTLLPVPSSADSNTTIGASTVAASVPGHSSHPSGSHTDPGDSVMAAINSTAGVNVTTVGKFSITTPASAAVAPVSPVLVTNGMTPVPTPLPTPVPPDTVPSQQPQQLQQPQPVAQHVGMSSQSIPMSDPVHHTQIAQQQQLDSDLAINRVPPDSGVAQMVPSHPSGPHIPTQAPIHPTLTAPYAPNLSSNLPGMFKVGPDTSATADSTARWNTFQQALQRLASGSLKGFGKMVDLVPTQLMQSSLTPGTQFSPNQQLTLQQLQLLFAVASALAPEQTQQSVAPGQQSMPTQSTGISGASAPSASQETLLQPQAINAGILHSSGMDGVSNQQPFVPNQPPVGMYPQAVAASLNQALFAAMSKPHATPSADPQSFIAPNLTVQSSAGAPSTDSEIPGSIDPVLLNQLTEALMSIQASASGSSQYTGFPFGPGYAMGLTQQTTQAAQPGVAPITGHHGNLTGTSQSASVVQHQQQPQQILAQSTAALSPKAPHSQFAAASPSNKQSNIMHNLRKLGASLISGSSNPFPSQASTNAACNFYSYPPAHTSRLSLASINPYPIAPESHRFGSDGCLSARRQLRSVARHTPHQPSNCIPKVLGLPISRSDVQSTPPSPSAATHDSSYDLSDSMNSYPLDARRPSQLTRMTMPVKRHSAVEPGIALTRFVTTPAARASGFDSLSSVLSPLLSNILTNRTRRTSIPEQGDRKVKKKVKSKPRYILRVTKLERDTDSNEPGALRPTFYLEMPDLNNPNSELWKLSFRCNLSDTPDDIKLFQGSGYTPANEEIDRAAKEAVVQMLESLRTDVNSIKVNQDYVFYPRSSAQLGAPGLLPVADNLVASSTAIPPATLPISVGATASTLLSTRSSQSSSNLPSVVSHSVTNQTALTPASSVPVIKPIPGIIPNSNSSVFFDGNPAVTNLEEVPPIDRIGQVTGGVSHAVQVDESGILRGPASGSVMDGGLVSMDTARDDEDEFSETSRPLSPIDGPGQTLPSQSLQHLFASGIELDAGGKNAPGSQQSSYLSTTSCPGVRPGHEGVHGVTGENADPALTKRPFVPFGIANMNDLLSLASKHVDSSGPTANGFQIGLEEVPPLAPGAALTDPTVPGYLQPSDSVVQTEFGPYDAAVGTRVDNPSHPSYEANSGLVSQLSQVSSVSQGRVCPSQPYCTSTPDSDSMINLTCTIPACLEALLRDITCRLCSAPSRPYILLPSTDGTYHDGTYQVNSMRILEVPNGHIFLGIPESKSPTQSCGSYSLTTFRAPVEPAFVVLNGMNPDSRVNGPHVYKTPSDCAVVLSPNGQVHRVEKAALVVPVATSDVPRTTTPPSSPGFDTGISHGLPNSSVQVRELPIQTNLDTLTFDDVLNLLLALRSTSQPTVPHRSTTASPTVDAHLASHPMAHVPTENQQLSTSTSRRSSALPGLHGVNSAHSLHGLLPAQLLQPQPHTVTSFNQLQSQSAGLTHRGTPQLQGSQATAVNAVTFHPDAHFQSTQITATHVPYQMQAPVSATSDASTGILGSAFSAHAHVVPPDTGFNIQMGSYGPFNPVHPQSIPPSTLHLSSQPPTHAPLKTAVDRAPGSSQPTSNVPVNLQQSLLQQLLQSQAVPPASSQSQIDSPYTAGQNVQQVLQLLSALNATGPDQVPSTLNQLRAARLPVGPHSVPLNSTPGVGGGGSNMGSTVQSRQASPPLPTGLKQGSCAAGTAPAVQPAALQANTVSPTTPSGPGVSLLPVLLNRLLSSGAANVDWSGAATLEPIRTSATQPATATQAAARPGMIPSVQPVAAGSGTLLGHDPTSLVHPTTLNSTAFGSGALQQLPQLAQHPGVQQKRGSQPAESQSFGLSAGAVTQPQHHMQTSDSNNLLCSLPKNPEAAAALATDVQNFLLGALQQLQKLQQPQQLQQSHIPLSAFQSGWMSTSTTHPAVTSSTVSSQSLGPKQAAPGSRVFPTVVPGSVVPAPAITSIDAMAPQPSAVKEPVKVTALDPITSQTVPMISTGDSVHRTAPANPTTVANKFTVVPVSSENEEPAPPSQVVNAAGGVVPWTAGPPRPPRRSNHPSGPPAPPVTPNSQLSTDSTCIGLVATTSGPGTSVMMVTPSSANIASSGAPVLPVALPPSTSVPVNSAQPKLVHSKFKVEPVTVTPSTSSTPAATTGTVMATSGIRNQRVTQAAGSSALPVPTGSATVGAPYVASTASNNVNNPQVSSNGPS